jgi:hypothetical protein
VFEWFNEVLQLEKILEKVYLDKERTNKLHLKIGSRDADAPLQLLLIRPLMLQEAV